MKAAPEGVTMQAEHLRSNLEGLNYLEEPIDTEKSARLKDACDELGLDRDAFEQIEFEARLLRDFETHGKAHLKTPRQRTKDLQVVEKLANALSDAMLKLDTKDQIALWQRLPAEKMLSVVRIRTISRGAVVCAIRSPEPGCSVSYSFFGSTRKGRVGHIGLEVENLANAARAEHLDIGDAGSKGGRKATLRRYGMSIGAISGAAKMPVGRGGPFEKLCAAVFEAAGVHSTPEGAIREVLGYASDGLPI
jgi:hypothetical protein